MATILSEDALRKAGGNFDLESNGLLVLHGLGIEATGSLQKCVNLTSLDLSSNKLRDADGLKELTKLQTLDLSGNNISHFIGIELPVSLETIHLSGNSIKAP